MRYPSFGDYAKILGNNSILSMLKEIHVETKISSLPRGLLWLAALTGVVFGLAVVYFQHK
jgi:hypothetical protein